MAEETIQKDGNPQAALNAESFTKEGDLKTSGDDLALVVQSAQSARDFITSKQWALLWRDADLLFQSPRPMTVYDNTYVLEPNVQRFTVAKICNAVVPQLYKGLFFDDPPMIIRPRPGTEQIIVDAKKALFSYILDDCRFKINTKWGLEQMALFGTSIWKWGYDWKQIETVTRKATGLQSTVVGPDGQDMPEVALDDKPPQLETKIDIIPLPTFEWRPLDKVLVDSQLNTPDIRDAGWVIDVQYMDFYQLTDLKANITQAAKDAETTLKELGWDFPSDEAIRNMWLGAVNPNSTTDLATEQAMYMKGGVHHAEDSNHSTPDPLRVKKEVLEYWDKKRKIVVLDNRTVVFSGANEFKQIPFLSANWWNRSKAFYGMGLGLIVGQNQRVDQGTVNAVLKMLSYGVNPIYLRQRNANAPTQMIKTGIGKVLAVDGPVDEAYHLLESPKVPVEIWQALKESEQATESSSGADQQLVQGSSAGPRSSMGRTAGGAAIQASASATRLDGPLDNFIEQVFKPFLYIMDMLVFRYMSDKSIMTILGKESGEALTKHLKMQDFHDAIIEYEVLAGAAMAAKRTMAQSMVMLTQILDNPTIGEKLAEINEEYIDYKPIIEMWFEASEWKNRRDVIKPMTEAMKQKRDANSKAALMQQQMQAKQQDSQQKFGQKQQLEEQSADHRIQRDLIVGAAKASGFSEPIEGEPSAAGIQGQEPQVQ